VQPYSSNHNYNQLSSGYSEKIVNQSIENSKFVQERIDNEFDKHVIIDITDEKVKKTKKEKKKKNEPSLLVNSCLTVLTITAAGASSVISPESVITPYLAGVAASTTKASARALDSLGKKFKLSDENAAKYGFLIKYPFLIGAAGVGFGADYLFSSLPTPLKPQLGAIFSAAFMSALFNDIKRKVILKKDQLEDDLN
jgi:hypothetical protein